MTVPVIHHRAKLRVMRLLIWSLWTAVLAAPCAEPASAQVFQDEVHIVAPSKLARRTERGLTLKTNVDLVLVNVAGTDSEDRFVSNLQAGDFSVLDGRHPQQIRYFSSEDTPISVAVILDASSSMENKFEQARSAAIGFFRSSNPQDEFAVLAFADQPRLLADFTDSLDDIESVLHPVQANGHTALWDAIYAGLREMRKARNGKKAMLVISDGGDNHTPLHRGRNQVSPQRDGRAALRHRHLRKIPEDTGREVRAAGSG